MKIETGIPITDRRAATNASRAKYPWAALEVGQSFFADIDPNALRAAAFRYGKRHGKEFKVRTDGDGARAWRTA